MERWERIAHRVDRETRPVRRFTKTEIAQQLKMSRPALKRRLDGEVDWGYDDLETLANLFGITVDQLVSKPDIRITDNKFENGTSVTEG